MEIRASHVADAITKIDYGWMYDIRSEPELEAYLDKIWPTHLQAGFHDCVNSREFRDALGESNVNDHISHGVGAAILYTATLAREPMSIVDALEKLDSRVREQMRSTLDETGAVFIDRQGAYFGRVATTEVSETVTLKGWKLPAVETARK